MMWVGIYAALAVCVVFLSIKLANYVDLIDKKTDMSGAFIGGVILAAVTSLPELFTSISAVLFVKQPDLVMGNILGSNLFNMCIFGGAALIAAKSLCKATIGKSHTITTVITFIMFAIMLLPVVFKKDYTVVGDQNPEHIARVAAHVDSKMKETAEAAPAAPLSAVAVLSAMNIADELFEVKERTQEMLRLNEQYEADTQHYMQLWEEAKNSFMDYKKDSQQELADARAEADQIREQLMAKQREVDDLMRNRESDRAQASQESAMAVEEVEQKYSDLENSYFDLQMENIRLKSEMEKLKGRMDWENR